MILLLEPSSRYPIVKVLGIYQDNIAKPGNFVKSVSAERGCTTRHTVLTFSTIRLYNTQVVTLEFLTVPEWRNGSATDL